MPATELWLISVDDPTASLLIIAGDSAGTLIGPGVALE